MLIKRIKHTLLAAGLIAILIIGGLLSIPSSAKGDAIVETIPTNSANGAHSATTTTALLKEMATKVAIANGLNTDHFLGVIDCETGNTWDTTIQSKYIRKDGTQEQSFGLVQINLPSHTNITLQQAEDPEFAINWMAEEWVAGRQSEWSCWTKLYGN